MLNIGIVVDNDFVSDIRVTREVSILKRLGHNVHVLCFGFDDKVYPAFDEASITRIHIRKKVKDMMFFFTNRFPVYDKFWKKHIKQFIQENDFDVLHVHDLYMSRPTHLAIKASQSSLPFILDLHENFPYAVQYYNWTKGPLRNLLSNPKAWLRKEGKYLGYASKIITLSDHYKKTLLEKYDFLDEAHIVALPNIIDLRRFESFEIDPSVKRSDKVTFMYFGAVAERRGIFDTIEVFQHAFQTNSNIELLIIGPVDKADQQRFANVLENDTSGLIRYIPWIELSELVTYMHISDVFLSPLVKNEQHESGVANKLFQYMYAGRPIIVSDCKPQQELVHTNDCGLSYTDQDEYLDCVLKLAEDENLRARLGKNAKRKLYEIYDNDSQERIVARLYDALGAIQNEQGPTNKELTHHA